MKYMVCLLKFFREEKYLNDFANGNIYANSLDYLRFVSNDPSELIGTSKTGMAHWDALEGHLPVTCFYAVLEAIENCEKKKTIIKFDEEKIKKLSEDLGPYVGVVTNVPSFLKKLLVVNQELNFGLMKYTDKKDWNIFTKSRRFENEHGFRIVDSKSIWELEIHKILKDAKVIMPHMYRLSNERIVQVHEDGKINLLVESSQGTKFLYHAPLQYDLYRGEYDVRRVSDLTKNHYLAKDIPFGAGEFLRFHISDLRHGVEVHFSFDQELNAIEKCELKNGYDE